MSVVTESQFPQSGPRWAEALIPAGVVVTLIGTIGDLLAHTLAPAAHAHEELFVLGRGNNPWHLVLFGGILLTAIGGIRWATRLGTDLGSLLAALMVLMLGASLALGIASGANATKETAAPAATAQAGHVGHGTNPAGTSNADTGAEGASLFGGHSHGAPGPVTPAEQQILDQQLAEAKTATARFKDIRVAKKDGFVQVTQFIPGLGLHLVNLSMSAATFDPARPQILLYEPKRKGGWKLAGVAYRFGHVSDTPPEGFAGGSDVWHFHTDLCFLPGGSVTIAPSGGDCRARHGLFQAQTDWLLHAWVWIPNPRGVFTEYNPSVF